MPWAARSTREPKQQKQAEKQSSNAISLFCSLVTSVIGGRRGHFFVFDGLHLGKDLSRLRGLALGARVVLFDRVCPAQLQIGRPEIGHTANCRLEMRYRIRYMSLGYQNGAQLTIGLGMAGIELQFSRQFRKRMIRIAVLPVEVPEPEMNAGKIGSHGSYGEILGNRFVVLLQAVGGFIRHGRSEI